MYDQPQIDNFVEMSADLICRTFAISLPHFYKKADVLCHILCHITFFPVVSDHATRFAFPESLCLIRDVLVPGMGLEPIQSKYSGRF